MGGARYGCRRICTENCLLQVPEFASRSCQEKSSRTDVGSSFLWRRGLENQAGTISVQEAVILCKSDDCFCIWALPRIPDVSKMRIWSWGHLVPKPCHTLDVEAANPALLVNPEHFYQNAGIYTSIARIAPGP